MEVILPDVRLSYPDIWKPGDSSKDELGQIIAGKFGAQGIIKPGSPADVLLRKTCVEVAKTQWKDNFSTIIQGMSKDKKCYRTGNQNLDKSGAVRAGYKDMMYVVSRNAKRPIVIASRFHNGAMVVLTEDGKTWQRDAAGSMNPISVPWEAKVPYGGCQVNMKLDIYAWDKPGRVGRGIGATLMSIQFRADGEAFGGGRVNADGFESMEPEMVDEHAGSLVDEADLFGM